MAKEVQIVLSAALSLLLLLPTSYAASNTEPSAAVQIKIDQIQFNGVSVFSREEIETTLEINPGDRLETIKAIKTAENVQALYRLHGYEQTGIQSRLVKRKENGATEAILEFQIKEGPPTRVAEIRFIPESRDASSRKYWSRIEGTLATRLAIQVGDIFDQTRITAAKRAFQDVLAAEEFVGGKVDDIRAAEASAPAGYAAASAGRWVALEFHIDLGDRVSFGFRGNNVFPSNHLSSLVEEQRLMGLGKDYVGAIRTQIESLYRSSGYAHVKAVPYIFERPKAHERHVTYFISEGPRVRLESLRFDGNSIFSDSELQKQFFLKASSEVQHRYYVQDDIQKAAELVIEWMKSRGYLGAKLVTVNPSFLRRPGTPGKASENSESSAVRVVVYIYEGDQTITRNVTFSGGTVFAPQQLKQFLSIEPDQPLDLFKFSEGLEGLKAAYRAKGYLGVRILNESTNQVIKYSHENRVAEISLDLVEGPQYKLSRVHIEGLGTTKENVVRREILFREDEILTEPDILDTEARLRRLGIFSMVTIRATDDPQRDGYKIVRISLQEGTPGLIAWGFGFRNDLGTRVFGQTGYSNLLGRNHTLSFAATANRRLEDYRFIEGQAQVAYLWPWFGFSELTFRPTFTVTSSQYIKFSATTVSFALAWERRLFRKPNLTGILTYNLERIRQFDAADVLDNMDARIGAIIPGLQLDMRDNPLSPTSGLFASGSFEIAAPLLLSQADPYPVGYTRFQFRSDYYIPLAKELTWFLSFRSGFEKNTQERTAADPRRSGTIPSIKTFALGGPSSLRGFKEQQLNVYEYAVRGTVSYVNYRTQLDLPFAGALRFGPFLDAANLLIDDFSFGGLRYGAGVGFHYQTPVGPVNLDWGFNINPLPGEDEWRFHFSIGVI
ncbi:MAG TPA: POTRA domain-containing protein [Bdellovibrionota bacterium]|nr:POTRA domain-containing protein [Bdellovibrionota bacterium]